MGFMLGVKQAGTRGSERARSPKSLGRRERASQMSSRWRTWSLGPCRAGRVGTVWKQAASRGDAWGDAAAKRPKTAEQLVGSPHPAAIRLDPPRQAPPRPPGSGCSRAERREEPRVAGPAGSLPRARWPPSPTAGPTPAPGPGRWQLPQPGPPSPDTTGTFPVIYWVPSSSSSFLWLRTTLGFPGLQTHQISPCLCLHAASGIDVGVPVPLVTRIPIPGCRAARPQ